MVSALCLAILISSAEEVREEEERHRVRSGLRLPTDAERCNSSQGEEVGGGCDRSWCCPVSPRYTVEELTTCQGRKKCNKDPKTRTAICQLHQFRPFDRIAGRTDTMTCSARLEQLFSDCPLYSIVVSESWNSFSGIHIIFSFLHRYLTFLETREILSLFTPVNKNVCARRDSKLA